MHRKGYHQIPHHRHSIKGHVFPAGRGSFKEITHRQFTHGDFDRDNVKNLDDRYPFDPTKRQPLDKDSRLTEEFDKIDDFRKKHDLPRKETENRLKHLLEKNKQVHVVSRLKTKPSILNKLNRKYLPNVRDTAGVLVETDNKKSLEATVERIKKSDFKFRKTEDFYDPNSPKPYYKAFHFDVKHRNKPVEVQVKTIRQRRLHDRMHFGHKTGQDTGKLTRSQAIKEAKQRDFWDSNPPHSFRKLKRIKVLREGV